MSVERDPRSVRLAVRTYEAIVRLLPSASRARWADELVSCFVELVRAAYARCGAVAVAAVLARSTWDLLLRLPREHRRG
ncbi:MAG TPA: hypothetical protein ENO23_04565, partial [Alphaproteobacteria bacterium]|nr:hypothetical protein [Alphaproteobacteria bacterium]